MYRGRSAIKWRPRTMRRLSLCLLTILCVRAIASEKEAKPFQEADMSTLAGLNDSQWTTPAQDGEHVFRAIKAGTTAVINVPVWWGDTFRPKEGSSYLAQILYKDTATSPVRVEVFAALPGRYQVHEFGGLNDGEWKTAFVPLPWDMLARVPDTKNTELALIVPAGNDLPVQKISISEGNPTIDEPRWEQETRDWIPHVQ